MGSQFENPDWEEEYDEDYNTCDGCGRDEMDDGWCPYCCPNGGWYAPGTEDCDFCSYDFECAEFQRIR